MYRRRSSDAPIPKPHTDDRFLGEWKLNTEKSSRVGIESESIKIVITGGDYRFDYDQAGENGTALHWWFVTNMNGECAKQTQHDGRPMSSKSCVKRLDPNKFVDNTLFGKDKYEVSRDGRRMTLHGTLLHAKMTLVFDRAATSN